jgi:diguanylate cyclase (GGDEF)-like protein
MEARDSTGVHERAVRGMRRLAGLASESDEGAVLDALVRELHSVLELESVTVMRCDERGATRPAMASTEPAEFEAARDVVGDRRRSAVFELHSAIGTRHSLALLAGEPHGLGTDDLLVAAALIDVAAVAVELISARREAATDELTGCLNRRAVLSRLHEEIGRSQRTDSSVSCLMFDVDNLKQINDQFGHLEGDRVLREVGASLRGASRAYDLAARYGGDEFLVLLPATAQRAAVQAGARMMAAVARIAFPGNARAPVPIGVSLGAATSRPGDLPNTLLQRADQALLNAKRRTHASRHRARTPSQTRSRDQRT